MKKPLKNSKSELPTAMTTPRKVFLHCFEEECEDEAETIHHGAINGRYVAKPFCPAHSLSRQKQEYLTAYIDVLSEAWDTMQRPRTYIPPDINI